MLGPSDGGCFGGLGMKFRRRLLYAVAAVCLVDLVRQVRLWGAGSDPGDDEPVITNLRDLLKTTACFKPRVTAAMKSSATSFLKESSIVDRTFDCNAYFGNMSRQGRFSSHNWGHFLATFPFDPVTAEEKDFPLAYAFTVHEQIGILELFLAIMFRPVDSYCFHVDSKAPKAVQRAVRGLVKCYRQKFPTTAFFVSSTLFPVYHFKGGSMLAADMSCIRQLLGRSRTWRKVVIAAGTELPLVSRRVFRSTLNTVSGNNIRVDPNVNGIRLRMLYPGTSNIKAPKTPKVSYRRIVQPPCSLEIFKGYKNGVLTRAFANFSLNHPVAWGVYNFLRDVRAAEEYYFPTMATIRIISRRNDTADSQVVEGTAANTTSPGGDTWTIAQDLESKIFPSVASSCRKYYRFKNARNCRQTFSSCQAAETWRKKKVTFHWVGGQCHRYSQWRRTRKTCYGSYRHDICNYALNDLPRVRKINCLFGNKFSLSVDPVAVVCQTKYLVGLNNDKIV